MISNYSDFDRFDNLLSSPGLFRRPRALEHGASAIEVAGTSPATTREKSRGIQYGREPQWRESDESGYGLVDQPLTTQCPSPASPVAHTRPTGRRGRCLSRRNVRPSARIPPPASGVSQ